MDKTIDKAEELMNRWQDDFVGKAFTYHPPSADSILCFVEIRAKAKEFAQAVANLTPEGVEQAQAFLNIQQAVMWANAAIALNEEQPKCA